jgi:GTP cyclohydrolase I
MHLLTHTQYVADLTDDKCDAVLGDKVKAHLVKKGLVEDYSEVPISAPNPPQYNPPQAVEQIVAGIASGLRNLGLDIERDPSLRDTPRRYAKMLVGELTKGLNFDFFPKMTTFPNTKGKYDQMVFLGQIGTMSLCEHHLQTIDGFTYIAYIPGEVTVGISKLARVTDFFARRPQVQERMTEQIYAALALTLETDDVAVVQRCAHYCMRARGAMQHSSIMVTDKMGGRFLTNPALRQEFLDTCRS